jgi:hypothetical protein
LITTDAFVYTGWAHFTTPFRIRTGRTRPMNGCAGYTPTFGRNLRRRDEPLGTVKTAGILTLTARSIYSPPLRGLHLARSYDDLALSFAWERFSVFLPRARFDLTLSCPGFDHPASFVPRIVLHWSESPPFHFALFCSLLWPWQKVTSKGLGDSCKSVLLKMFD